MPHRSHLRGLHGIALIATYLAACGDESPGSPTGADGAEDVSLISDATPGVDSADPRDAGPEDISETNAAADTGGERCLARVDAGDETLDLGLAVPGFPATSFVQIANTCTYALTVAPPTVLDPETGSDAGLFAASLTRDDGLAVEGQLVAAPGERFVVWVWMAFDDTRYSAEAPTHGGVVQVSTTGGERVEVPVSASMRAESCLVANPASISFGTLVLGDTGVATVTLENVCDQRIELRSTETNAASLVSARLEGGSAEILDGLHPLSHSLAPHERVDARFSWTPEEVSEQPFVERAFRFISSLGAVDLEVSGACSLGPCPRARIGGAAGTVPAGQPVTLDAGGSVEGEGGAIVAWSWTLVAPEISASTLNNDDTDSVTFTPDVSGLYTVTLRVTDASGIESCAPGSLALTVSGEPVEIVVTLTWSTPSGVEHPAGAPAPDPNLHLAHPDAGQFDLWGDAALEP